MVKLLMRIILCSALFLGGIGGTIQIYSPAEGAEYIAPVIKTVRVGYVEAPCFMQGMRDDAVKSAKARLKDTSFGRKLKTVQLKRRVLHEKFLKSKLGGRLHAIISAVNDLVNNRMVFWNLLKQKIMQKILGYVLPYIIQVAVIMIVSCIVISFSVSALGFVWSMFTNPIDGTAYGSQEGVITQDQGNRDLNQPEVPTPND